MIDVYYWTTPNGHKLTMFLEETGLAYTIKPVNISRGEQFAPEFLAISPNNRIPAIVDHSPAIDGGPVALFESGAILLYLADKSGRLIPADARNRWQCIQWLFWQMAGLGPMAGQNHHFGSYAIEPIPYAVDRYVNETGRLYAVLDRQLRGREFIVGVHLELDVIPAGKTVVAAVRAAAIGVQRPSERHPLDAVERRTADDFLIRRLVGAPVAAATPGKLRNRRGA